MPIPLFSFIIGKTTNVNAKTKGQLTLISLLEKIFCKIPIERVTTSNIWEVQHGLCRQGYYSLRDHEKCMMRKKVDCTFDESEK